jgi:hypothetical protein
MFDANAAQQQRPAFLQSVRIVSDAHAHAGRLPRGGGIVEV